MEIRYKKIADAISPIIRDAFVIALVTFVVYFFADVLNPGLVTNYINLNKLLLFVVVFGIVTVLIYNQPYDRGSED